MAINLELLRTFLTAVEAGTFRAAAARRFVTISAVSQQIRTLESQLGVALFQRLGRRVQLTADGQRFAEALRPSLAAIDDAVAELERGQRDLAGWIRIGGPRSFSRHWLSPRLHRLMARHPGLALQQQFDVPSALERSLSEGGLDLALLVRAPRLPAIDSAVVAHERFVAVAAPGLLADAGAPRELADFRRLPFAIFDRDLAMHQPWWHSRFGAAAGGVERVVAEVPNLEELVALARAGLCACVLPSYLVQAELRARTLVTLEPRRRKGAPAPVADNAIHLAWRRGAVASARVRAVQQALLAPVRRL